MKIPIAKPYFGEEEKKLVLEPLESGWVVQGPFVQRFEQKFAAFAGARFAAATTSCTTALHLSVVALGLKPGDEVIVPAFTWVATANAVEYQGARPVFCDIDLKTFNLDVAQLSSLVTPRTVGIIPVHLFGLAADMDAVMAVAKKHRLWVVEDAACAFGGRFKGRHAGTFGDAGCFSFHPRKSITTGEGGMVTTERADLDALVRSLRDHGATRSDLERHTNKAAFLLAEYPHVGYNYRMTDIQGALGCAQMDRGAWILAEKTRRARRYDQALARLDWLEHPAVPPGYEHGYQAYVCLFRPETPSLSNVEALHDRRNRMMAQMEAQGISTRQGTHAAALQRFYAEKYRIRPQDFPNAYLADRLTVALPLYAQLSDAEQDVVVDSLVSAFKAG